MSTELLPCPFCGGEASVQGVKTCLTAKYEYYPRCRIENCPGNNGWISFGTNTEAVAAWNRRFACGDWEFCCNTCDHKCAIAAAMAAEGSKENG